MYRFAVQQCIMRNSHPVMPHAGLFLSLANTMVLVRKQKPPPACFNAPRLYATQHWATISFAMARMQDICEGMQRTVLSR